MWPTCTGSLPLACNTPQVESTTTVTCPWSLKPGSDVHIQHEDGASQVNPSRWREDINMTGESRSSRPRTGSKRSSSEVYRSDHNLDYDCYPEQLYDRVFDYQRVPVSMATISRDVTPPKRPRSSSSSSSSVLHRSSRERFQLRHRSRLSGSSSSTAKLRMEELRSIKKELTVIKVQIDELLDSLDEMDRQRRDHSEGSVPCSPYPGSGGSTAGSPRVPSPFGRPRRDRESPEPGEASDDDSSQMTYHSSDFEYM